MSKFNQQEMKILRDALHDAHPRGISSNERPAREHEAFDRLFRGGYLESRTEPVTVYGRDFPHYLHCRITEKGREAYAAEQAAQSTPTDDSFTLELEAGRKTIVVLINGLHAQGNALAITFSAEDRDMAVEQVKKGDSQLIQKLHSEWLPQIFLQESVQRLLSILSSVG